MHPASEEIAGGAGGALWLVAAMLMADECRIWIRTRILSVIVWDSLCVIVGWVDGRNPDIPINAVHFWDGHQFVAIDIPQNPDCV